MAMATSDPPKPFTEDEIFKIYNLISRELERKEYERLITMLIALNNFAKSAQTQQNSPMR